MCLRDEMQNRKDGRIERMDRVANEEIFGSVGEKRERWISSRAEREIGLDTIR